MFQNLLELIFVIGGILLDSGDPLGLDNGAQVFFMYFGILIAVLVNFSVSYFALLKTELITSRILGKDEPIKRIENKLDLLEVTLVVIGCLTVIASLPELLYQLVDMIYFHNHSDSTFWSRPKQGTIFRYLFQLGLGVFVIMNAQNFATKLQCIGTNDDKMDEKSES